MLIITVIALIGAVGGISGACRAVLCELDYRRRSGQPDRAAVRSGS
jgi:hypothetical protein